MTNTDQADALKPCPFKDDFRGDDDALLLSTQALLELDADNALVPHGIGGHARGLLNALAARLNGTRAPEPEGLPPWVRSTPGDWTEDFGHENGCYQGRCCECNQLFNGHKRRVVCKLCVEKQAAPTAQPEAGATGEHYKNVWGYPCEAHTFEEGSFWAYCKHCHCHRTAPQHHAEPPPESQPTAVSCEGEAVGAAKAIWADLLDRRGIRWECEKVEEAIVIKEILPTFAAIIQRAITAATFAAEQALREADMCDVCAGTGKPESGRECICKGTGKMSIAATGLREALFDAEQAKAQAEQERYEAILREQTTRKARELMQGERDQAEQRAQAAEVSLRGSEGANRTNCKTVRRVIAERDAARTEVEQLKRGQAMDAECIERCQQAGAKAEVELVEAREALRAALIPLAVLKMGQQTKPYAEHTATLTAEIASAHDAVYTALLKAQEGNA